MFDGPCHWEWRSQDTGGKEKDDGEVERAWCYEDGAVQQVGIAMRMTQTGVRPMKLKTM